MKNNNIMFAVTCDKHDKESQTDLNEDKCLVVDAGTHEGLLCSDTGYGSAHVNNFLINPLELIRSLSKQIIRNMNAMKKGYL